MRLKLEKRKFSLILFVSNLFVSFVVCSCTSSENDIMDIILTSDNDPKTTRSGIIDDKLIAIAESDEFMDFLISAKQLIEKVDEYKVSINKKELREYSVEDIFENINIEKEINQLSESRNKLRGNILFLELNDIERFNLFNDYVNIEYSLLKTREEGGSESECNKKLQEGYKKAETLYEVYVSCCESANFVKCVQEAIKIRDNARERADYEYVICMGV